MKTQRIRRFITALNGARMMRGVAVTFLITLCLNVQMAFLPISVHADVAAPIQDAQATLNGIVKHGAGEVIEKALILLTNTEGSDVYKLESNEKGMFSARVRPGNYAIWIIKNRRLVYNDLLVLDKPHSVVRVLSVENPYESKHSAYVGTLIGAAIGFVVSMSTWVLQKTYDARQLVKYVPIVMGHCCRNVRLVFDSIVHSTENDKNVVVSIIKSAELSFDEALARHSWVLNRLDRTMLVSILNSRNSLGELRHYLENGDSMLKLMAFRRDRPEAKVPPSDFVKLSSGHDDTDEIVVILKNLLSSTQRFCQ